MKTQTNNALSIILGFIVLAITGFFVFKLVEMIIKQINQLNANIVVAILAGSFTIIGYFITRFIERKKHIEQQIREQKLPIYDEFVDFVFKIFEQTKSNQTINSDELEKFWWKLNKKSILWLSDKSLKSYIDWKNMLIEYSANGDNSNEATAKMLLAFEKLLLDFRKDIGHKNEKIISGDILTIFITDWNKYKSK